MTWRTQLHPELVKRLDNLLADARDEGYDIRVVSAYRSHAEQDKLFRQRPRVTKARGGKSWHNYGLAADLAPFIDGAIYWDEKKFHWSLIGKWAKAADLEWGGNWASFKDRPHVQLIEDLTTQRASTLYKNAGNRLTAVWAYITENAEPANDLVKIQTLDADAPKITAIPFPFSIGSTSTAEDPAGSIASPPNDEPASIVELPEPEAVSPPAAGEGEDQLAAAVGSGQAVEVQPPIVPEPVPAISSSVETEIVEASISPEGDTTTKKTITSESTPVEVTPVKQSLWSLIVSFFMMIYGYYKMAKEDFGNLIDRATDAIDIRFILNVALGAALVLLGVYVFNLSKNRASKTTDKLIDAAKDQNANTVVFKKPWWQFWSA